MLYCMLYYWTSAYIQILLCCCSQPTNVPDRESRALQGLSFSSESPVNVELKFDNDTKINKLAETRKLHVFLQSLNSIYNNMI